MDLNVSTFLLGGVMFFLFVTYAFICQLVFKALFVSYGCRVGRGVVLMLFVIYARHLLVSN